MSWRQLVVPLAVVLLLVGTWLLVGEIAQPIEDDRPEPAETTAEPTGAAEKFARPAAPETTSVVALLPPVDASPEPVIVEPALDPDLMPVRITGRVVDTRGRPFPGVLMTLYPEEATLRRHGAPLWIHELLDLPDAPLAHSTTDSKGCFVLEGARLLGQHGDGMYGSRQVQRILARAEGYAWHGYSVPGDATASDHDLGDLVLGTREVRLQARFVDEAGAPVEGVWLFVSSWYWDLSVGKDPGLSFWAVWHRRAVSAADGRATLTGLWPGWFSMIRWHTDYLRDEDEELSVTVKADGLGDLGTLVMLAGGAVSGWVLAADGSPLQGAEVFARDASERDVWLEGFSSANEEQRAALVSAWLSGARPRRQPGQESGTPRSDADGFFRHQRLVEDTADLIVGAEGYEPRLVLGAPLNGKPLELRLQAAATAEIQVVSAHDDRPLPQAVVRGVRRSGVPSRKGQEIQSTLAPAVAGAAPGRWLLTGLGPLGNDVHVEAPGHAARVMAVDGLFPGEHTTVRVLLEAGARLSGRLVDRHGQPVFRGRVTLTPLAPATSPEPRAVTLEETTDAEGVFAFDGLGPGHVRLEVDAQGFLSPEPIELDLVLGEERVLQPIVLGVNGTIAAVVLDPEGAPAVDARVRVWRAAQLLRDGWSASTDEQGRCAIDDLTPGDYVVSCFPGVQLSISLAAGETLELILRQRAAPRLRGMVTAHGQPVEGAHLTWNKTLESTWSGSTITGHLGRTDATGHFDVEVKGVGLVLLLVGGPEGGRTSVPVQLDWGDERRVDIALGTATLAGRLDSLPLSPPDAPEAGFWAVLLPRDQDIRRMSRTITGDGGFRFGQLNAGRYRLLVIAKDEVDWDDLEGSPTLASSDVSLAEGETRELVLETAGG